MEIRTVPGDTGHGSAETPSAPSDTEFADMKGHWAESALRKGIELGLLKGSNGKMLPNDPVRGSEALTILNRALGASQQDSTASLAASQQDQWYTAELGKAIHLNLIDANDSRNFGNAATRPRRSCTSRAPSSMTARSRAQTS